MSTLTNALHAGVPVSSILTRMDSFLTENPAFPVGAAIEMVANELIEKQSQGHHVTSMTYEQAAQWILKQPSIMQYLGDDGTTAKKIQAIKELRGITYLGLKESKQIIEYTCYVHIFDDAPPWFHPEDWADKPAGSDIKYSWIHHTSSF